MLGDRVYGGGFKTKAQQLPDAAQLALKALNRQALHARALGFDHPVTRENLLFESAPPEDFRPCWRFCGWPDVSIFYFEANEIFRSASERQRPDR